MILPVLSVICFGCEDDTQVNNDPPQVTTAFVEEVSFTSAVSGGTVISDGGAEITDKGICWSLTNNPSLTDEVISSGPGSGSFDITMEGLEPATMYFIRAYATNSSGTGYGEERSFRTRDQNQVQDIDGNWYESVAIGDQIWMARNLEVTKLRSGTPIANVTDNDAWANLESPGYTRYNNDGGNAYGLLYNGYTIATNEVCPEGWHLPSRAEWNTLIESAGGQEIAGGKLKDATNLYWEAPNTGATNELGFTALPGGLRYVDGTFRYLGQRGYWWAAREESSADFEGTSMTYDGESANPGGTAPVFGLSIRCVKD